MEKRPMTTLPDMEKLDEQIQRLKQAALALSDMGNRFPAIKRNAVRILSSIKMMEINVSDIVQLSGYEEQEAKRQRSLPPSGRQGV
jgi:hypothetical protein